MLHSNRKRLSIIYKQRIVISVINTHQVDVMDKLDFLETHNRKESCGMRKRFYLSWYF